MSLSIVIPSCGRSTLENTVNGLMSQLFRGDEIIIVGPRYPEIGPQWSTQNVRFIQYDNGGCHPDNSSKTAAPGALHGKQGSKCGGEEKDIGFAAAEGTHILTIDDDDIFTYYALSEARIAISRHLSRLHIFRMRYGEEDQWRSHLAREIDERWEMGFEDLGLVEGNIGGSMYLYPRIENAPKHTRAVPGGEDYHTFMAYVDRLGSPVWHDFAWSIIRPSRTDLITHVGARYAVPKYTPQPLWMLPDTPGNRLRKERWRVWRDLGGAGEPPSDWDGKPNFRPA